MTLPDLLLLSGGGFCAGFVDSIAGGGGLIALPLLLSIGLPPQTALGTNKLQSSCRGHAHHELHQQYHRADTFCPRRTYSLIPKDL
ncbi:hypothetical protein CSB45_06975 [candidate division KSB3 bacterium]|uniref:Probable membrane transporter protein n=1 Tax=candidate division KSB3 bacterium TaxID=2044937 RepID=A0A2G6E661_9BACT|nr:MAG: hypothetical protein CSB45_06975 [candidate division KSB3 bacterium]PIE30023.1 MAG: hypothetical protein CSA57_05615 [candidate division KSB3 bacterium]